MLRSPYPKRKVGRRVGTGRARERPSVDDGNRMRSKRPPPPKEGEKIYKKFKSTRTRRTKRENRSERAENDAVGRRRTPYAALLSSAFQRRRRRWTRRLGYDRGLLNIRRARTPVARLRRHARMPGWVFPEILLYNGGGGYATPSFYYYLVSSTSVPTVPAPKVKPNPKPSLYAGCRPCVRRDGEIPELSNRTIYLCEKNVECLHARTCVHRMYVCRRVQPRAGNCKTSLRAFQSVRLYTLLYISNRISSGNYTSRVDSRSDRLFETIMDMVRLVLIFIVVCRGYITI